MPARSPALQRDVFKARMNAPQGVAPMSAADMRVRKLSTAPERRR
jgi:hypothetical protein